MGFRQDYVYVDGMSSQQTQWRRVRVDQIAEKIMAPASNFRCFASVQRYQKPHGETKEKFWMPIFFDFDHKDDPGQCIDDVKKIVNFFHDILQIPSQYIRIYFSGSKGFHVLVEPEVFDIRPAEDLHLRIKKATMYLAEMLELRTYDPVVYSVRRVLRLPNSIHEKTKLFKIELTLSEVTLGIDWIKATAKHPKKSQWEDSDFNDIPVVEDAKTFWDKIIAEYDDVKELVHLKPSHKITDFGELPVCMSHLLGLSQLPRANTGNRTILSMATYLKDAGKSEVEACAILIPWFTKLTNVGGAGDVKMLSASAASTIKYVYHRGMEEQGKPDAGYTFACKYILGLSTGDHKIPCQGVQCPAIKGKEQVTKDIIDLELREFSRSGYLGEKVRIPALLSGKAGTPYVIPKRVRITCTPGPDKDNPFCERCPVAKFNGEASYTLDARDPQVLEMVATTNKDQTSALKRKFRAPQECFSQHLKVEEYMNVEEVRLSPAAADIKNFESTEYVVRKGFFLGYPIEANKRYKLTGYPVKEPRSQASAFLFEDREKLATDIESFRVTPEIIKDLSVFQVKPEESIDGKWTEIHRDLASNVYRLIGREQMAFAIDLVAHSTRGFTFRTEPFVKGWAEIVVVGDSGCGKSKLVEALVHNHYGVGEMLDGASSKRTGLLYSYQETGKAWMLIWGAFPLNDGGLITVDEFGDLPDEQFALMTEARSSGRVKATGIVTAETFARVRFIALTNPKKGKHLAEYDFPCTALKELVPAAADIRRFDLACAVSSNEVPYDQINSPNFEKVPHVYNRYLCQTLVKWVWSRDPSQVIFEDAASVAVLKYANQMAKEYYAGEIPLVEPADQRFKIARLSAAAAARVFSTDETGERIIVKEDHVDFTYELLSMLYMNPNFRYYDWSRDRRKSDLGDAGDMEALYAKFQNIKDWRRVLGFLSLPGQIESKELDSLLGDRTSAQNCINVLRILGLVEKKWGKYQKTARGFQFPKWSLEQKKVTQAELDQAMMGNQGPLFEGGPTHG